MGEDGRNLSKLAVVFLIVLVIAIMAGLMAGIIVGINRDDIDLDKDRHGEPKVYVEFFSPHPDPNAYWWDSEPQHFRFAAVAAESEVCSEIGTRIMGKYLGSAVDAAVATLFCLGVVNPHASGIGGGHFMNVYDTPKNSLTGDKEAVVFVARETAPAAATSDMYTGTGAPSSLYGGQAIGIPGELLGYHEAWSRFGRLEWNVLVQPAIELARDGFNVSKLLALEIQRQNVSILETQGLRDVFAPNGVTLKEGDWMMRTKLADTLELIAQNPLDFYDPNSQLSSDIIDDIQAAGGIITANDLGDYEVAEKEPLRIRFDDDYVLLTPPPPSSGIIVGQILKILTGFNFDENSMSTEVKAIDTYQRIVESFKLSFAQRGNLGDADFVDGIGDIIDQMLSDDTIRELRSKINMTKTQPLEHYEPSSSALNDAGTTHVSVYASNGGAVAVTSAINTAFGSFVYGEKTGIIFNNDMNDFAKPGMTDVWGLPASQQNMIESGKRPMSSQSPCIVLNNAGEVVLVDGASGGGTMITTIALSIIKALWFGWDAQHVVDDPRLHHQLTPEELVYQPGFLQGVLDGLKAKGHMLKEAEQISANQLIMNTCLLCESGTGGAMCREECGIAAVSDGRRHAESDGY